MVASAEIYRRNSWRFRLTHLSRSFRDATAKYIRLLAPAGCGKTLCLLVRCAHLAELAAPQRPRFLIVTFTVAAKQELSSRLFADPQFASIRDFVEVTTLNSWGFRRIRTVAFNPNLVTGKDNYHFAMLNQLQPVWKAHDRVRQAIEAKKNITPRKLMNLMDSMKSVGFDHLRHAKFDQFAARLSELRTQGLGPKLDELFVELVKLGVLNSVIDPSGDERAEAGAREVYKAFFRFWCEATQHMIESATFTLEDQKYFAYLDERQKLEEGKFLAGAARSDHVLVDEFQDINPLDLALVNSIVKRNKATLTIVGDDDQAIFEWRGATPEYILNPAKYLGVEFATFTLAINYRSPRNIVDRSQQLISNNTRRVSKPVTAKATGQATIDVRVTNDLAEAMALVYKEVQKWVGQGRSPSRVAIIGRKKSQLIPYQVFFASKDVSFCAAEDLHVFLGGAFDRLLQLIMIKSRAKLKGTRSQVADDILTFCNVVKRYPLSKGDREELRRHLTQSTATTIEEAIQRLSAYRGSLKGANPEGRISTAMADAIQAFLSAATVADSLFEMGARFEGLQIDIGRAEDDIFFADPPFLHLAEYARRYGNDYEQFVQDIERAKDQLAYIPPFHDDKDTSAIDELWKRPVHLMTALRAKGKEFDSVILLDVNDGIWPNKHAVTPEQREAERRVFYVAFTRAMKTVLILVSRQLGNRDAVPSPYITELGLSAK